MAGNVVISASPKEVLVDETFILRVTGLGPEQRVTIRSVVAEDGMKFSACGCYVADSDGCIDVSVQPSLSGTYTAMFLRNKLWKTDVKLLSICSGDDCTVPPELQQLQYDSYPANKKQNIELVVYHGAGHLVEPPYSPFCRTSLHKIMGTNVVWGGNARDHAYAQEDSWKRILNFLRTNLEKHSKNVHLSSRL